MADIREQKLLYHLTALDNMPSIFLEGLKSRAQLSNFADVADPEILAGRQQWGLENFVPFHWFAGNPFDGRVQIDNRNRRFVMITVRRAIAARENWKILPRHPLANGELELLDYAR